MESHHSRSIWGLRISQNAGGGEWKGQRLRNLEVCDVFSLEREAQLGRKVGEGKAENGDGDILKWALKDSQRNLDVTSHMQEVTGSTEQENLCEAMEAKLQGRREE